MVYFISLEARDLEDLKIRLTAIESKPQEQPFIQRSSEKGVYFNYYGARQKGSASSDARGWVEISYRQKGSERKGLFTEMINIFQNV